MPIITCDSDICYFNKEGKCEAPEVHLEGNKLQPQCQTIEWNPEDIRIYAD